MLTLATPWSVGGVWRPAVEAEGEVRERGEGESDFDWGENDW